MSKSYIRMEIKRRSELRADKNNILIINVVAFIRRIQLKRGSDL